MRVDATERLAAFLTAGRAEHDPRLPGSVGRSGRRQVWLRISWTGRRPVKLHVVYDDGAVRRQPAICFAGGEQANHSSGADNGSGARWEYLARLDVRRPVVLYVLEAELAGAAQHDPAVRAYYGPEEQAAASPLSAGRFRVDVEELPLFSVPRWIQGAVLYQIFPDRFYNAERSNDPPGVEPWGGEPSFFNFFGGDLEGIRRRLDYLAALGVSAIYLNPIVEAPSNHRYDAADYMRVDPALGQLSDFRRLVDDVHRRGMKIILDAVFNHTGETFWAFEDVVRRGPDSPYFHWYHVHQWPIRRDPPSYACWWNLPHLPKLNTTNPEVRAYLFEVTRFWMGLGADGWRLDVPNELEPGFWQEWRELVKGLNPDAFIVGEIWHDAAEWLRGDQFDAVMNYPLRDALIAFLLQRSIGARELVERLSAQARHYPPPAFYSLMNLLGSHDTERIMTVASHDRRAVQAMFLFAMAWPGLPAIYYGDEVGMTGGKDPGCRRCFPWDERRQDLALFRFVRALVHLRRRVRALAAGELAAVEVEGSDDVAAFGRLAVRGREGAAICVISRSDEVQAVALDVGEELAAEAEGREAPWTDLLSGRRIQGGRRLMLELQPWDRMLLVPRRAGVRLIGWAGVR